MSSVPISNAGPSEQAAVSESAVSAQPTLAMAAISAPRAGEIAAIDASVRTPVLLFFGAGILWLLLATALGTIDAIKLNFPPLLAEFSWLTIGRLHPAATNALIYGWAGTAGIGASLWIMARLCRTPLRYHGILEAAWALWNVGVGLGVFGILYGQSTSYLALEFPRYASPLLFSAFVIIALWVGLAFRNRTLEHVYIAQWYVLAAFLFFPWTYATANLLLFFIPVQAPAQAVIAAWYAHSLVSLFFVPIALAAAYYIVPKVLDRPIANYRQAKVGFWTWLLFAGWSGAYALIGGPLPTWLVSFTIAASVLTLLPVYSIFVNFQSTLAGRYRALKHVPSLRFVTVGLWCFFAAGFGGALGGFRAVNSVLHFTLVTDAAGQLLMYGFVSLVLFGAIYYITSRVIGVGWESPRLIRAHFWFSVTGFGLATISLLLGGLIQGLGLGDAKVPSLVLLSFVKPFLFMQLVGVIVTGVGHACLAASFGLGLARIGQPTLLVPLHVLGSALAPGRFTREPATPNDASHAAIASVK